jgi:hypothetical protein
VFCDDPAMAESKCVGSKSECFWMRRKCSVTLEGSLLSLSFLTAQFFDNGLPLGPSNVFLLFAKGSSTSAEEKEDDEADLGDGNVT